MDNFDRKFRRGYTLNIILSLITIFGIVLFVNFVTRSDIIETPAQAQGSGADPYESPPPTSPAPTAKPKPTPFILNCKTLGAVSPSSRKGDWKAKCKECVNTDLPLPRSAVENIEWRNRIFGCNAGCL